MLQFNEDVFIESRLMIKSALKEHMLKQSNLESHTKIMDIFNEVTVASRDVIWNSFVIEEEVNESCISVDSGQFISSEIQNNRETNDSKESISDQILSAVIPDAEYFNDSLVSNEVFSEFEKSISDDSNSGDIIINVVCSHNSFVSCDNQGKWEVSSLLPFLFIVITISFSRKK
ncbi:unnamed protein product [Schistosoma mattheei]|uniref:Uncharacterized protein n=1 Tax=Schistosoma mattheei TaxID=31246 RepID=A0A183Q3L5_9TREM|nr:unnamed protein product [Schistosoma mattheei]